MSLRGMKKVVLGDDDDSENGGDEGGGWGIWKVGMNHIQPMNICPM